VRPPSARPKLGKKSPFGSPNAWRTNGFFLSAFLASACAREARPAESAPVVTIGPSAAEPRAIVVPPEEAEPRKQKAYPLIWEKSEPVARARSTREGLPLLITFGADWSAPSIAMDRQVWSDPRMLLQRSPIVALRIDATDESPVAELLVAKYDLDVLPTTLVLDAEGREVARFKGVCDVEAVLEALGRAARFH